MRYEKQLSVWAILLVIAVVRPPTVSAEYATIRGTPVSQGQMRIAADDIEAIRAATPQAKDQFILKETRVDVEISGVVARVRVDHVFENPYDQRLEAVYVFPLPEDAAIDGYWFRVGEQVVRAVVKEREEARREYEQARDEGRKTALLEQERPDIFTQSVANIPPKGTITVHLEYVHPVEIDGDRYTLRFPMVVAPRYIPGSPAGRPNVGRGWGNDTDQVPDASRITPQSLPAGMRSGNDVHITVKLDAGMPIQAITPVTHELAIEHDQPSEAVIQLKNKDVLADKDFIVEYRLAGEDTVLAALTHCDESGGYFALVLQPKWQIETAELAPREVILLLDRSGSMRGPSIGQLRIFAGHVLDRLNPQDTFRIIAFSNSVQQFQTTALPATPANVAQGQQAIRQLRAGGGTRMLPALEAALGSGSPEQGRARYLVLVTDALVGNDTSILRYLSRPEVADVRVFPVAMGAAPNHYLISRAAEINRGFALQVTNQDNAAEMAERFNQKIASPFMTDLEVDFGSLAVTEVLPQPLPDLYAGQPLVLVGRYETPDTAEITLRGNLHGQAIESKLKLELPAEESAHDSLGPLWARRQIRHIWNRDLGRETPTGRTAITQLGLTHQLVTRFTSFVAVEQEAPEEVAGDLRTQDVRPMLPEGMTDEVLGGPPQRNLVAGNRPPAATPSPYVTNSPAVAPPSYPAPNAAPRGPAAGSGGPAAATQRRSGGGGGGGGGGAVEWLFLASLGALGGGRLLTAARRRYQTTAA
jgi:Ca-activated chloride channel family protein